MTTSADAIIDELHALRLDVGELLTFLRAQAEANEPQLFCPPSEHCQGGFPLMKHAQKYWKNDGADNDRFYHELPQKDWYTYEGEGAFKGSTVRNHNVWRSEAVREGRAEHVDDDFEPPWAHEDVPTREVEAAPTDVPTFANAGQFFTWALHEYRMQRTDIMRLLELATVDGLIAYGLDKAAQMVREHKAAVHV